MFTIDTILLAIIASIEATRLFLTYKRPSQIAHFTSKIQGVEQMIWDLQFKLFKTAEIREDIRKEHEASRSRLETITKQLEAFPKDGNKDEKARLEDTKVRTEKDCERFVAQMQALDVEMHGSPKTNEYPDGATGITHQIDSYRELQEMLKQWLDR